MNFLALDQSSNITGWSIFNEKKQLIEYGIINISKMSKDNQTNKRIAILNEIEKLILKFNISQVITEGVYFHSNARTHEILAKVQGSIQDYCTIKNIACFSWENAGEWRGKLGIKGKKREDYKEATKQYSMLVCNLSNDLAEDIYDAIGIALAYFAIFD